MVRLGLGRFGMGFWVGLRVWGFPTERALSRTALILEPILGGNARVGFSHRESTSPGPL